MPFWSEPRSDECNFLSLTLSTLCSALMNSFVPSTNQVLPLLEQLTNTRQREAVTVSLFIPPLHPHAFNPTATTHGNFVLSPVSLASRDQDGGPSDSTIMQHLRSHGKIGDCEQSILGHITSFEIVLFEPRWSYPPGRTKNAFWYSGKVKTREYCSKREHWNKEVVENFLPLENTSYWLDLTFLVLISFFLLNFFLQEIQIM